MHRFLPRACLIGLFAVCAQPALAQDPAAIVNRAIKAHGGEDRLARIRAVRTLARGTLHFQGGAAFTSESFTQVPAQVRTTLRSRARGQDFVQTQILNGDRALLDLNGQTRELDGPAGEEVKETVHAERVANLLVLKTPGYRLAPSLELRVAGRAALGVRVSFLGRRDVILHFDRETGLLLRLESSVIDGASNQLVRQEKIFGLHKEFDGIQRATRIVVYRAGQLHLEAEVSEVQVVDKFPESMFQLP